jgi:predicted RNA-binding protein with TRAM domain
LAIYGGIGMGFGDRDSGFDKVAPVREGDEVEVTIEAVGAKGDGIAKKEGFVIFVPNTNKDDVVKIKITRVLNNMAFAEVVGEGSSEPSEDSPAPEGDGNAPAEGGDDSDAPAEDKKDKGQELAKEEQPVDTEDFGEGDEEKQ